MKFTLRRFPLLVGAFFCAGRFACGQAVDVPTTAHGSALIEIPTAQTTSQSNLDNDVTMAGEYKSTKNVVEERKPAFWNWYVEDGYMTQYNFRGVDLTPESHGVLFSDVEVTKWNFTLGFYGIHQLGEARAPSFSLGESGGSHKTPHLLESVETIQSRFNEIDVFTQYHHEFGPIDVTVGNIAFFIDRRAKTFFEGFEDAPVPTIQDEEFDRLFIKIATAVIPHIQPLVTYYQTVISQGSDPGLHPGRAVNAPFPYDFELPHERNDEFGGYLEGRLREFFSITDWLDFNAYEFISYSFHDRNEAVRNPMGDFRDIIRGRSLTGFNNAQVGVEFPIHLFHFLGSSSTEWAAPDVRVSFVPFGAYSYHISPPTASTARNEGWGGAKFAVTF
ncbi:MAG TPA: hypothetical protein VNW72_00460 [Chthoniobacterales bacterium]|jgi:hypothetical protein|nr:hypothetical protein [Chthoniobacterales bacterium]